MIDIEKKASNDERYDNWSNDGLVKQIWTGYSEQDIATADKWHEIFGWKAIAHHPNAVSVLKAELPKRVIQWSANGFVDILKTEKLNSSLYDLDHFGIVISYERNVDSSILGELADLQDEGESLAKIVGQCEMTIANERKKADQGFLFFRQKPDMKVIEHAMEEKNRVIEELKNLLVRVSEVYPIENASK